MAGILDTLGDSAFNPLNWPGYLMDAHKEGQARDEARTVRAEDRADQALNQSNQLTIARESIKAGGQGTIGSTMPVGQDTAYLNTQGSQNAMSSTDRTTARLGQRLLESQIEGQNLDNLKKSQDLKKPNTGSVDPGTNFMPGGSQAVRGGITEKPMQRTVPYPGHPHMEPGGIVGSGFEKTPTGYGPIPSSDVKERIEDSPYELRHFYRYGILPNFGDRSTRPPQEALPKGAIDWQWSTMFQEWQPAFKKEKLKGWPRLKDRLNRANQWLLEKGN